ncbi:hypothetical protein D3C78_124010 [compost metagenome]
MNYTHLTQEERYQIYALFVKVFLSILLHSDRSVSHLRFVERSNVIETEMVTLLNMLISWQKHVIAQIIKLLILLYGNRSKVILLCNGVLNRLLHILLSVCIQFTIIFFKIKLREVIYISIYVLGISARGGMDI